MAFSLEFQKFFSITKTIFSHSRVTTFFVQKTKWRTVSTHKLLQQSQPKDKLSLEEKLTEHTIVYFLVLYFFCIKAAGINRESIRKTVVHPTRKKSSKTSPALNQDRSRDNSGLRGFGHFRPQSFWTSPAL